MNLKKTLLSLFAATALTLSFAMPAVQAGTTSQQTSVNVNEAGEFDLHLESGFQFGGTDVAADDGDSSISNWTVLKVTDLRTSSPGFNVHVTASNLTNGEYYIENSNITWNVQLLNGEYPDNPVVGNNSIQNISINEGNHSMGSSLFVTSGDEGRGVGVNRIGGQATLTVPGGTATGPYTGSLTVEDIAEVGN